MTPEEKLQKWGPGPWVDEPDRVEFYAHGLACLMVRNKIVGHWCGYVAVPPEHPLHGVSCDSERVDDVVVHGGLTYEGGCFGDICHAAKSGEADDVWWLGFDAAHAGDLMPGAAADLRELKELSAKLRNPYGEWPYRDEAYVRAECEALAKQLAERA